jgi:hypothetical protein
MLLRNTAIDSAEVTARAMACPLHCLNLHACDRASDAARTCWGDVPRVQRAVTATFTVAVEGSCKRRGRRPTKSGNRPARAIGSPEAPSGGDRQWARACHSHTPHAGLGL